MNREKMETVVKKYELFLDMTKSIIGSTEIYAMLEEKYDYYSKIY